MDALIDSGLMQMPGPRFLAFYAVVAAIALVLFNLLIRLGDNDSRPPPLAPARPDPYEIAYLRNGAEAVIGVAVYALKRMGAIELRPNGQLRPLPGGFRPANPIEAEVLSDIGSGADGPRLLRSSWLRGAVESLCHARVRRLDGQGLLIAPEYRVRVRGLALTLGLGLAALAALKIVAALSRGHNNVQLLVVEAAIALFALWASARVVTRQTANARGKAYLDRIKLAFPASTIVLDSGPRGFDGAENMAALTLVGAFGFDILRGGPDAALAEQMRRQAGGDGGGSSCGGGDGGGGGCGGCGSS